MAERYGKCRACNGKGWFWFTDKTDGIIKQSGGCFTCGDTGCSGDIRDYEQRQYDVDWDKDKPKHIAIKVEAK